MKLPLYGADGYVGWADVNAKDFHKFSRYRWNYSRQGYAYRRDYTDGRPGVVWLLHRVIMGLEKGDPRQVDHINGDRLDCRRRNLRIVTRQQQGHNIYRQGDFTSDFRGVSWDKKTGKWVAYCHCQGKKHVAGYFKSERKAAKAAKELRLKLLSHAVA
jgi:hypothetical protein